MAMSANRATLLFLAALLIFSALPVNAEVTCSESCLSAAQIQDEASKYNQGTPGSKCLVIYSNYVYDLPSSYVPQNFEDHNHFSCGADLTSIMQGTHKSNTNYYLVPYKCTGVCAPCADSDGDGYPASSCGGTDCNDNNPAINPAIAETCNGIDDNCNGQTDEDIARSETCGVGLCQETIAQTCSAGQYTPSCVPGTPEAEICENGIDENCDEVDDSCSGGNPVNTTPISGENTCIPVCDGFCGQDNSCGGRCPYYDYHIPGKCGNSLCIANCSGPQCGQSDGCEGGGYCGTIDKETCGLCGNPPCCVPEICGDNKDNSCDGQVDEYCGKLAQFFGRSYVSISEVPGLALGDIRAGAKIIAKPDMITRVAGILAFFFSGLAVLIGVFRFEMIKRYSRKEVIKYHTVVGFFVLFFLIVHLAALLLDNGGWAKTIHIINFFVPYLSTPILKGVAYGVIGMYLLILVILNGVIFVGMSRKFGYPMWLLIHRASFAFYALVLIHSMQIGTDFQNPYIYLFFLQMLILSVAAVIYRKIKIHSMPSVIEEIEVTLAALKKPMSVYELSERPELAGKTVVTSGNIVSVPAQQGESKQWYQIYDKHSSIFATVPEGTKPDYYPKIIGTIRVVDKLIYVDVKKVWVK